MSIRTYIRVRAIRYNETRIGISAPPTFSATTVGLDMRAGPAGAIAKSGMSITLPISDRSITAKA
jgi:hypothetical protein